MQRLFLLIDSLRFQSAQGGVIWAKGTQGPLTNYGKNVLQSQKANVDIVSLIIAL